jgi:hypothetical protein
LKNLVKPKLFDVNQENIHFEAKTFSGKKMFYAKTNRAKVVKQLADHKPTYHGQYDFAIKV